MKQNFKIQFLLSLSLLIFILGLNSCEDPVPTDYKQDVFIEAYLLVDEPIRNILIRTTIPITDSVAYDFGIVRDAKVKIIGDGREFDLSINQNDNNGYFYTDTTYLIKSDVKYRLEIDFADGSRVVAETITPNRTEWIKKSNGFVQYPKDTLNLPATDTIAWKSAIGQSFYMLSVRCLDTLEYGKYLNPPTDELNRRVYRPFGNNNNNVNREYTQFAFIPNTRTSVVWNTFRFFGKHEVAIYTTDWNMTRWFIQVQANRDYSPLLGSVEGKAIGVFGSAAAIRDTFILLKNQP